MKSLNKLQPKHKILLKSSKFKTLQSFIISNQQFNLIIFQNFFLDHHHHKLNVNHNKETSLNKEILPTNFVDEEHFLGSPSEVIHLFHRKQ